jgi:N-formylglutamate deformylase
MLMITIPHSGEQIPENANWLKKLPEEILMCDVDRFVDRLYEPTIQKLNIPYIKTQWHRYAGDLNRLAEDVDCDSVIGNPNPSGQFSRGFIWVKTTLNYKLLPQPISATDHQQLKALIFDPFHAQIKTVSETLSKSHKNIYHLDLHSMPSVGTSEHRDPGEKRADIVVSDSKGKSSSKAFVDLVISSYKNQGFNVAYNWPYFGGRLTEAYGKPTQGHHTVQVELNRGLYMDETSKKWLDGKALDTQSRLSKALSSVYDGLRIADKAII